jgi:hypothetical protein
MQDDDNETWLLNASELIWRKELEAGRSALSPREHLIDGLAFIDYCMRNAGDLANITDGGLPHLDDARSAAIELGLQRCIAALSLPPPELEQRYFDLFDAVMAEVRAA